MSDITITLIVTLAAVLLIPWLMRCHTRRLFLRDLAQEIRGNLEHIRLCQEGLQGETGQDETPPLLEDRVIASLLRMDFAARGLGRDELAALRGVIAAHNAFFGTSVRDRQTGERLCREHSGILAEMLERLPRDDA